MGESAEDGGAAAHDPGDRPDDGCARRARAQRGGLTIREITGALGLPRTSIYRILNTLQRHEMVRRDERGGYHLGRRLLGLAARVAARGDDIDVAAVCQPFLDRLAADLGEGVKLSVLDADGVLVLAAAPGPAGVCADGGARPADADPCRRGEQAPAGGAAAGGAGRCGWRGRWSPIPPRTITEPKRLRAELARIRRQGWAQDRGENAPSILAFAAPVRAARRADHRGAERAVPRRRRTRSGWRTIRRAAIEAARAISAALPRVRGEGMKIVDLKCAVIGQNPVVRIVTDEGIYGYGEVETYKPYLKPHVLRCARR